MRKRSSKGGGAQRSIQVHLMVNEEEAAMIRAAARKRNQTVSLTIIEAVKLLEGSLYVEEEEHDSPTVQALREIEYQLRRIGRIHDFARARSAVLLAHEHGFSNISLDLMYGLPGQTQDMFLDSLSQCLALEPTHLSCYGLKLEPMTEMGREAPVVAARLPAAPANLTERMYRAAMETMLPSSRTMMRRRTPISPCAAS